MDSLPFHTDSELKAVYAAKIKPCKLHKMP